MSTGTIGTFSSNTSNDSYRYFQGTLNNLEKAKSFLIKSGANGFKVEQWAEIRGIYLNRQIQALKEANPHTDFEKFMREHKFTLDTLPAIAVKLGDTISFQLLLIHDTPEQTHFYEELPLDLKKVALYFEPFKNACGIEKNDWTAGGVDSKLGKDFFERVSERTKVWGSEGFLRMAYRDRVAGLLMSLRQMHETQQIHTFVLYGPKSELLFSPSPFYQNHSVTMNNSQGPIIIEEPTSDSSEKEQKIEQPLSHFVPLTLLDELKALGFHVICQKEGDIDRVTKKVALRALYAYLAQADKEKPLKDMAVMKIENFTVAELLDDLYLSLCSLKTDCENLIQQAEAADKEITDVSKQNKYSLSDQQMMHYQEVFNAFELKYNLINDEVNLLKKAVAKVVESYGNQLVKAKENATLFSSIQSLGWKKFNHHLNRLKFKIDNKGASTGYKGVFTQGVSSYVTSFIVAQQVFPPICFE